MNSEVLGKSPVRRSRTGCFSCRRRKKKCDELSYPICQNCSDRDIECEWPLKKHQLHQKLREVRYVDDSNVSRHTGVSETRSSDPYDHRKQRSQSTGATSNGEVASITSPIVFRGSESPLDPEQVLEVRALDPSLLTGPITDVSRQRIRRVSQGNHHGLERKQQGPKRYILNRIALQQDCVDSEDEQEPRNSNILSPDIDTWHSYASVASSGFVCDGVGTQHIHASPPIETVVSSYSTSSLPASLVVKDDLRVADVCDPKSLNLSRKSRK